MHCRASFLVAVAMLVCSASSLQAGVVVGLPAVVGNGDCIPFGCPATFGTTTYQQVYSSAAFSGSIDINTIAFFNTEYLNGGKPASGTYGLSFSYTSKAVGALDTVNPANNITSGSQAFFSGSLPGISGGELTFAGSSFLYNPTLGNLLLTVSVSSGADGGLFLDMYDSSLQIGPPQTSRAYFGEWDGGNDFIALVTEFDNVPEPNTMLLLAIGIGALVPFSGMWGRGLHR